jgi:MoaA/NifB/PqqE/SkfB family radical SAM enzyme
MCDIWKDNKNLKQLTEDDIKGLLESFRKLGTQQVVMSGGEALLNANFFTLCNILEKENIEVTLLSTGLTLKKNAEQIIEHVHDVIVSLDGDEPMHDAIRNISGAFNKLKEGIAHVRALKPDYKITCRTVIHQINFRVWDKIIESAKAIGIDQISFLPADVSSQAFNRETPWDNERQGEVIILKDDLEELKSMILHLTDKFKDEFENRFIAESPEKLMKIYTYYSAQYGLNDFPVKKCNAPWVSTVVEADGTVRPCFFHNSIGNIREQSLDEIINSDSSISFRKNLDMDKDSTCVKCVCYLNLPPRVNPAKI